MATVLVQPQTLRHSATPPPVSQGLTLNSRPRTPTPIPNKHLPTCPTGPAPSFTQLPSPPPANGNYLNSLLYPPDRFKKLCKEPPIYAIDASTLAAAIEHLASQPLPDPKQVFPWLHGLHPDNHMQSAFFVNRKRSLRRVPKCLRALTIVKAGGDLSRCRIKGAVAPEEILENSGCELIEADPPEGFSVRNFHIQAAKLAPLSDIVIYGDEDTDRSRVVTLAERVSMAQQNWRFRHDPTAETAPFNTFILSSTFQEVERSNPKIVAIGSSGQIKPNVMDFFQWERIEMCSMSKASEISNNVWLGPSPEVILPPSGSETAAMQEFGLLIETSDAANIPGPRLLEKVSQRLANRPARRLVFSFPSSGSVLPTNDHNKDVDDFISTVRWIYYLANPEADAEQLDAEGDTVMESCQKDAVKILIHCPDGYTESSLLAVAYFMFAEGLPLHEAWLKLHTEKRRNFFAYPSDVTFLQTIQHRLLSESPVAHDISPARLAGPDWLERMDGSLPSRILPYMYLGNLTHANNPELLYALGIRRILSVGEPVSWTDSDIDEWGEQNLMFVDSVQDNGIDPLTQQFDRCLEFIEQGKRDGTATLVHCRVGVSRSATICIAEVMASLGLSFPRAYCFVRARRLNVIIQPHLRFVYELLKWEETQQLKRKQNIRRELEWATVCREIALMNKPYSRQ